MQVLLFSNNLSLADQRLRAMIKVQLPAHTLQLCRRIESLQSKLKNAALDSLILILVAHDLGTLAALAAIQDHIQTLPNILVLPNHDPATLHIACHFSPCAISYVDSDFSDIALVLAKMRMRDACIQALNADNESLQPLRTQEYLIKQENRA